MPHTTLFHFIGVAVAGGLGTLARYAVGLLCAALWGTHYPWGTYIVNMLGCFLFGLVSGLIAREFVPSEWRVLLLTGFLGGFTTFSAFAFENHQFLVGRQWKFLAFHLLGQNILGILAALLGLWIVERFLS